MVGIGEALVKQVVHRAADRGHANFGWLDSWHSFSFGSYYHPDRMGFGLLRVLNDDTVAAGAGFGTHPHENMEIVSIPLAGALRHRDSTGNEGVIRPGDVQIMSAGTGIRHSEYNDSGSDEVRFLQIWVFPREANIQPRYEQKSFSLDAQKNRIVTIVSPDAKPEDAAVRINQNARFSLADLDAGGALEYQLHDAGAGLYAFVIEGSARVGEAALDRRDAVGLQGVASTQLASAGGARLLLIEVPLQ